MDIDALAASTAEATQLTATKVSTGYSWPETPRWHDGALHFSDMYNHKVLRMAADGTTEVYIDASGRQGVSEMPGSTEPNSTEIVLGGLGWLADGRAVVVSMHERLLLSWDGASLEVYADLRDLATSSLNDMVMDTDGRCYVTQLGYDLFKGEEPRNADILVVEPDGSAHALEGVGDFNGANGITVTADGTRIVVAEVGAAAITQLERAADGTASNRSVFAQLPWLPDGICLDEKGGVWAGLPGSGYVLRYEEGGAVSHAVPIPVEQAMGTAVILGGDDRSTLYIAAGLEVFDWAKSRDEGLGSIWTVEAPFTGGTNLP